MIDLTDIIMDNGYLVDSNTMKKIIWYECDPNKNTACAKTLCRIDTPECEAGFGFCSKTPDKRLRRDGGEAWYAVLKTPEEGEPYWGREYIEEV